MANPFQGKLFNRPDGQDVRGGCKIDYRSTKQVQKQRVLAALSGNARQGDKMLWSDQESKIIVYIVGGGAQSLLAMPKGEQVYAQEIIDALKEETRYGPC